MKSGTGFAACLIVGMAIGVSNVAYSACEGSFSPPDRSSELGDRLSKSVFSFRGGTAYYIGGESGYLLTAYHVVTDGNASTNKVCSPKYSSRPDEMTCFDITVVDEALPEWDLALLKLVDPLPGNPTTIEIASSKAPNSRKEVYTIFGFGKPPEAIERTWSSPHGPIIQKAAVTTTVGRRGDVPLVNKSVYHVNITQYKGASGGPLIGRHGYAWATAVRSTDANNTAYGIPHNAEEVILWLARNTNPSQAGKDLIGLTEGSNSSLDQLATIKDHLVSAMDAGSRVISHLDLIHWTDILIKANRLNLWYQLFLCPISKATTAFVDWDTLVLQQDSLQAKLLAINVMETAKEDAFAVADEATDESERAFYFAKSGDFALQANQHLVALMARPSDSDFDDLPSSEREYLLEAGAYFDDDATPWILVANAEDDSQHSRALYQRYVRNLNDATKAYLSANAAEPTLDILGKFVMTTSLTLQIETRRIDSEYESETDWGDIRESLEEIVVIGGQRASFDEYVQILPIDGKDLSRADAGQALNPAYRLLQITREPVLQET